jgi:hypothetical protein
MKDLEKWKGKTVVLDLRTSIGERGGSLGVDCRVHKAARAYGHLALLVSPVSGEGRTWVRKWTKVRRAPRKHRRTT